MRIHWALGRFLMLAVLGVLLLTVAVSMALYEDADLRSAPAPSVCNSVLHLRALANRTSAPIPVSMHQVHLCVLVRSTARHGGKRGAFNLRFFVDSLLRQSQDTWLAYFFLTDELDGDVMLREAVSMDPRGRIRVLELPSELRRPYSIVDAAYAATDTALRMLWAEVDRGTARCDRLVVTNSDNYYGEHAFAAVAAAAHPSQGPPPDLVLLPFDSRHLITLTLARDRLSAAARCARVKRAVADGGPWSFASVSLPVLRMTDLGAVALSVPRFRALDFSFSQLTGMVCKGCQDGLSVESLVRDHRWSFHVVPASPPVMLNHGPSLGRCLTEGYQWMERDGAESDCTEAPRRPCEPLCVVGG